MLVLLASKQICSTLGKSFEEISEEEYMYDQQRDVGAHFSNVFGDLLQLQLQRGGFDFDFVFLHDETNAAVITNHESNHLAFATSDTRAGLHNGRR